MADIKLTITLLDINVAKAEARLLKAKPNIETVDGLPESDLKYPSTKLWAEELCKRALYRFIRVGHELIQKEAHDILEDQNNYLG